MHPNSPHLISIPSLAALTTRRLARADLEILGRQAHWALNAQVLALGALDELGADFLQRGDLAAGESDADLVDLGAVAHATFLCFVGHGCGGLMSGLEVVVRLMEVRVRLITTATILAATSLSTM